MSLNNTFPASQRTLAIIVFNFSSYTIDGYSKKNILIYPKHPRYSATLTQRPWKSETVTHYTVLQFTATNCNEQRVAPYRGLAVYVFFSQFPSQRICGRHFVLPDNHTFYQCTMTCATDLTSKHVKLGKARPGQVLRAPRC